MSPALRDTILAAIALGFVLGVLVAGWFLLGIFHIVLGLVWTLAKIAVLLVLVVAGAKFLFGRSKSS